MSGPAIIDVTRDPEQVVVGSDDHQGRGSASWTFVRWLLVCVALAMAVIGAVNWYVDPTGVTGRTTKWQVADNSAVRSAKLDLYDAAIERGDDPEVVLLGSSRTMKFDPAVAQRLSGASTFNAAVSGGVPRDAWLFVQYMDRFQDRAFPHLVWGLDADAFRGKQLREGLSTDPRMSSFVPWQDRVATKLSSLGTLTEWQTLDAAIRSVRAGGNPTATGQRRFSDAGMQLFSRRYEARDVLRNRAIRRQTTNYANFVFGRDGWEHVEQDPLDDFESVVRLANRRGDVPTIFITPYHPIAEQQLAEHDLAAKRREVLRELRKLQRQGDLRFELVDYSDPATFGADPREWYDGVHMTPKNTAKVLAKLQDAGLLAPNRGDSGS